MIIAAAVMAAFAGSLARAEDQKPDNEVSFNASISSDYRLRAISQSRLKPSLHGGVDYTHNPSGFYAGTLLSYITWIKDTPGAGSTPLEVDLYGGKRGDITKDFTYDVGVMAFIYPGNNMNNATCACHANANTAEIYGQVGYGPAYIKYSRAMTNFLGSPNSKNSGYLDLGANIDVIEKLVLNLHVGHQVVVNHSNETYTDWRIGLTRDFGVVTGAIAVMGTNADKSAYTSPADGSFLGKTSYMVSVSKTF